jgi:hypothetical protein
MDFNEDTVKTVQDRLDILRKGIDSKEIPLIITSLFG